MTDHMPNDLSAAVRDLRAFTDELRPEYPVVRNVAGEWVLPPQYDSARRILYIHGGAFFAGSPKSHRPITR